jgi:hypothetical protein
MAGVAWMAGAFIAGAMAIYVAMSRSSARLKREDYIRHYVFPSVTLRTLTRAYPGLDDKDLFLVARALRQYFLVHLRSQNKMVGMPSRVVDALWHELILDTKTYHAFCTRAFGSFFHHVPASNATSRGASREALRRTWRLACLEENIDPKHATRLPLLFAIDAKLKIPDGHVYDLDVIKSPPRAGTSGCGGFGCSSSGSGADGCSGGCGGGCGGS